ncbi:MAG TPA: PAS domain S-box protein, partial [Thermoplasmata archaeon]|nr:PAS domain S-box protein [Thermoplasmata archaeon]
MTSEIDRENLLSGLRDGVFVCSKEGELLYANSAMAHILGVAEAEILSKNLAKDFVQRNLDWLAFVSLLEQGSAISDYEMKFRREDGVVFCSALSASLIKNPDGSFLGIAGTARDITTRKSVENDLRENSLKVDAISRIARTISGCRELRKKGLVTVRDELRKIVDFDQISLSLIVEKGAFVEVIAPETLTSVESKTLGVVPVSGSMLEELKFRKDAIVIEKNVGLRTYSEFLVLDASKMNSMISVPLRVGQRVLGALTIFDAEPGRFEW